MLSTPPCFRRWNCSEVGVACGTTPQKFAGTAPAVAAVAPPVNTANARATANARDIHPHRAIPRLTHRVSSPSGRPERRARRASRRRRWRIRTTAREIAARTAIAIRIGTSGEEPPSSLLCGAALSCSDPAVARCRTSGLTRWCLGYPAGRSRHRCPRCPGAEDFEDGWFPPEPETIVVVATATAGLRRGSPTVRGGRLARRRPGLAAAAGAAGATSAGPPIGRRRRIRVLRRRGGVRKHRKAGQCQQSQQ